MKSSFSMERESTEDASKTASSPFKEDLRRLARALGFQLFGVAPANRLDDDIARLHQWLDRGDAANMKAYLGRDPDARGDPARLVEGARSVVAVGMSYAQDPPDPRKISGLAEGRIARFATAEDYHAVLRPRLERMARFIAESVSEPVQSSVQVDSGFFLERAFARRAGLGFIGKNACLIHPRYGSWFVLGALVTTADIPADEPLAGDFCGECHHCLHACPTGALREPRRIDARRCRAYLTIENRREFSREAAIDIGDSLIGCDLCQEACPFNRGSIPCEEPALRPAAEPETDSLRGWSATLESILSIHSDLEFERKTKGSGFQRLRREGLLRNAAIVCGKLGRRDLASRIGDLAADREAPQSVRDAASWTLERLK